MLDFPSAGHMYTALYKIVQRTWEVTAGVFFLAQLGQTENMPDLCMQLC